MDLMLVFCVKLPFTSLCKQAYLTTICFFSILGGFLERQIETELNTSFFRRSYALVAEAPQSLCDIPVERLTAL